MQVASLVQDYMQNNNINEVLDHYQYIIDIKDNKNYGSKYADIWELIFNLIKNHNTAVNPDCTLKVKENQPADLEKHNGNKRMCIKSKMVKLNKENLKKIIPQSYEKVINMPSYKKLFEFVDVL